MHESATLIEEDAVVLAEARGVVVPAHLPCLSLKSGPRKREKSLLKSRLLIVTAFPKDSKMGCACRILCWIFWVNWLLEPETKPRYCMTLSPRAF